ncbi:MAG: hypothetical protein M3O31_16390 [Acidobacteriota bacterium]|nr:hypothetical protein [Acidobacteriota bacterium]
MSGEQKSAAASRGHVRYLIAFMLFAATAVNYPPFANGGPQLRKFEPAALLLGPDMQIVDPAYQLFVRSRNGR